MPCLLEINVWVEGEMMSLPNEIHRLNAFEINWSKRQIILLISFEGNYKETKMRDENKFYPNAFPINFYYAFDEKIFF